VTLAYVAVCVIDMIVVHDLRGNVRDAGGWWAVLAVAITLLTAVPPLYGAWRALSALGTDR
jgi:hypothetical protein